MLPTEKLALVLMTSSVLKHTSPKAAKVFQTGMWCSAKATACQRLGLTLSEIELFYKKGIPMATQEIGRIAESAYQRTVPKSYQGKILPAGIKSASNAIMSLSGIHYEAPEMLLSQSLNKLRQFGKKLNAIVKKC